MPDLLPPARGGRERDGGILHSLSPDELATIRACYARHAPQSGTTATASSIMAIPVLWSFGSEGWMSEWLHSWASMRISAPSAARRHWKKCRISLFFSLGVLKLLSSVLLGSLFDESGEPLHASLQHAGNGAWHHFYHCGLGRFRLWLSRSL